jgi:uncharacterized protein YqeY
MKKDRIQAFKDKNEKAKNLLSYTLSLANDLAKNDGNRETTEEDLQAVVKKTLKHLNKAIKKVEAKGGEVSDFVTLTKSEIEILEKYSNEG